MNLNNIKKRIIKDLSYIEEKARTSDKEMSEDTLMLIKNLAKTYYYVHEAQEKIMEDMGIDKYEHAMPESKDIADPTKPAYNPKGV